MAYSGNVLSPDLFSQGSRTDLLKLLIIFRRLKAAVDVLCIYENYKRNLKNKNNIVAKSVSKERLKTVLERFFKL